MTGYWRNPQATAETIRHGWLHTGDVGTEDEEGFIFVIDRLKDMIISGGENIYSREVEDVLASHPAVIEAAVIGRPDARWGESVLAFVVPRAAAGVTEESLIDHCRRMIAPYKRPQRNPLRRHPAQTAQRKGGESETARTASHGKERTVTNPRLAGCVKTPTSAYERPLRHSRESGNPGVLAGGATRCFPTPPRLYSRFRGNDDFGVRCLCRMAF